MTKQQHVKNIFVFGFMLFASFFGAGNLIFPPYLGIVSGPSWISAFAGFTFADAGLALLAVMAIAKCYGNVDALFNRAGKRLAVIIAVADILCVGPLLVIPRTGATTYEMGITPIFGTGVPIALFVAIFFALTFVLTVRPSKVVDIVGEFLTPALLIALAVIIIKGIVTPIAPIVEKPMIERIFAQGISDGYQTMDAFVSIALGSILVATLREKGYKTVKEQFKLLTQAGIIACVGLSLVYGGLFFLGATVSSMYGVDAVKSQVIVNITHLLLGSVGRIVLGIVVSLACLTTAIGLTSATAKFFSELTKGKLSYEKLVLAVCIFSAAMASIGVNAIVAVANPILSIVYPPTIVLIFLAFARDRIKNNNIYKFAVYMALAISIITVAGTYFPGVPALQLVHKLPFASLGFNWVVPTVIAGFIGKFFKSGIVSDEELEIASNI